MHRSFWFRLLSDDVNQTPASTTPPAALPTAPAEDVSGLKNTISTLRAELKKYEGIDPDQARTALTQLPTLQEANRTLADQVNMGKIDSAVSQAVSGSLSQYAPLLATNARGLLQVNDKGEVVSSDGRSVADINAQLRTQYPAMFQADVVPAGSGTAPSTGSATPPPASVVNAPNGIISGVSPDDIIKGNVKINAV